MRMVRKIYLDTNVLIDLTEGYDETRLPVDDLIRQGHDSGVAFVTSALTFSELLVRPYKDNGTELIAVYKALAQGTDWLQVAPVDGLILDLAARLRATTLRLKLPDAIHLATAWNSHCSAFVTADRGLSGDLLTMAADKNSKLPPLAIIRPDRASLAALLESMFP